MMPFVDETGRAVAYVPRGNTAQLGHLLPEVAVVLAWHGPVQ